MFLGVTAGADGGSGSFRRFNPGKQDAVDAMVKGLLHDPLVHLFSVWGDAHEWRGVGLQDALFKDAFPIKEELERDSETGKVHAHVLVFDEDEVVAGRGCVGDFVEVSVRDVGAEGGFSFFEELDEAV